MQGIELGRENKLYAGRKKAESGRSHGATARDRHAETLLVGHNLVVMCRLMEIGEIKMLELANKKLELMGQAVI